MEINIEEYTLWLVLGVAVFSLLTFFVAVRNGSKLNKSNLENESLQKRVAVLEDDVKAIYDSVSNMGHKINTVMKDHRILKEQQEQLTLKEPSQQSYRNAIQQIRNGESISKIAESSGLSQGEIELLKLLNASQQKSQSISEN